MNLITDVNHNADKNGRRKLAAVIGMFDGVHLGHRFMLDTFREAAAARGLSATVFTFPRHPLTIVSPEKAPRLLTTPAEKLRRLGDAGFSAAEVDFMVFDDKLRSLKATDFMAMLRERYDVSLILRGFNNRFGTERDLTPDDYRNLAAENGIELIDAPHFGQRLAEGQAEICSSAIRVALDQGDIISANAMLGYRYSLTGIVRNGKQLGRKLGFPTANVGPLSPFKLIPADGVYICMAHIGDDAYRAMVNIGNRPTVDGENSLTTIEAHLLGFEGNLYGYSVTLEFVERIRPEIRFESLEMLVRRLNQDRLITENHPM